MKIIVGRRGPNAHYIGRGSPLGNPFVMRRIQDRDLVCEQYQKWFDQKIAEQDPAVFAELHTIWARLRDEGTVTLGCFCAPQRCHGETIKAFLDQYIKAKEIEA